MTKVLLKAHYAIQRPPRPLWPKVERRPLKQVFMTIAIGVCANKGVVLASDSQHTVSGYIKSSKGKIKTVIFSTRNVFSFVGSGTSDYIETAIEKAIEGLRELNDFNEVVKRLETNLLEFFDKHLSRWAYFPDGDRPTVELLIAISMLKGPFALFHYSGTAFHRVSTKAIGVGLLLANDLMSHFVSEIESVETCASRVVYVLSKVKEQVDTCGGFTDLIALRKGGDFVFTDSSQIQSIEKDMKEIEGRAINSLRKEIGDKSVKLSWHSEHRKKNKAPTGIGA